MEQDSLLVS